MRILVVAATRSEASPVLDALDAVVEEGGLVTGTLGAHLVGVLVSGVGMVPTAVWCSRALMERPYDLALNLGICGSFNAAFPPPSVVHVASDMLPELGAEDGERFLPLHDLGLQGPDVFPWTGGRLVNARPPALPVLSDLPRVSGITVNTVHGADRSIAEVTRRCQPDVESMEGAAFMYACLVAAVPFAQVRAVSNRVERRNRAAWDIAGAVTALGRTSLRLLGEA